MPASPSAAVVAEVEYYQQLILDHFGKLRALDNSTSNNGAGSPSAALSNGGGRFTIKGSQQQSAKGGGGTANGDDAERIAEVAIKRAKAIQRISKAIDQLRKECEKLAVTGITAETAAAMVERQKRRFGLPTALTPSAGKKSPSAAKSPSGAANSAGGGSSPSGLTMMGINTEDPALAIAEKWRWQAYAYEIEALFAAKFNDVTNKVTEEMWDQSLVASTLRSRMHALLMELIPLERVMDGGRIRRGANTAVASIIGAPVSPTSASSNSSAALIAAAGANNNCGASPASATTMEMREMLSSSSDAYLIKILTANVQDALEQMRSTCRDAIAIKETSVVEARLKANAAAAAVALTPSAQQGLYAVSLMGSGAGGASGVGISGVTPPTPASYHALHATSALTSFELLVVQFMAAEAVRIAQCYGIVMEGGNAASGASATNTCMDRSGRRNSLQAGQMNGTGTAAAAAAAAAVIVTPVTTAAPPTPSGASSFGAAGVSPSTPGAAAAASPLADADGAEEEAAESHTDTIPSSEAVEVVGNKHIDTDDAAAGAVSLSDEAAAAIAAGDVPQQQNGRACIVM